MSRPIAQFALAGLAVLALFAVVSVIALRGSRTARRCETRASSRRSRAGHRRADHRLLAAPGRPWGDRRGRPSSAGARARRACRAGELWGQDGRILYSDEPRLIGSRFPLDDAKREALRTGGTKVELSALAGPENRYERGEGALYEVYLPIRTPDGTPLLFETYQRRSAVAATGRRIWAPFAALLLASLALLWLVQIPLAARLDRRLRKTQEEREALLRRAVEASAVERPHRRRAPRGAVHDLAGISYSLSAAAQAEPSATTRGTLAAAAAGTRGAMRRLRSLLVEIHPPNLRASGLEAALDDAAARLRAHGVDDALDLGPGIQLSDEDERLVYRAAAESLRNVERHARATHVAVALRSTAAGAGLQVADDGVGSTAEERRRHAENGHVGLSLLEGLRLQLRRTARVTLRSRRRHDRDAGASRPMIRSSSRTTTDRAHRPPPARGDVRRRRARREPANGEEAVDLGASLADVALIDLEMPVLDGIGPRNGSPMHPSDDVRRAHLVLRPAADPPRLHAGAVGYLLKDARTR